MPVVGLENFLAATATAREVKALNIPICSGSLGLFFGVSVTIPTGASIGSTAAHDHYRVNHFVPLLTTSYA
jgi:hypothetical protein